MCLRWRWSFIQRGNGIKYDCYKGFKAMVQKWLHSRNIRWVAFGAVGCPIGWVTPWGFGVQLS